MRTSKFCVKLSKRLHLRSPVSDSWLHRKHRRVLNVPFGIVDLSLAPTPAIGDSVCSDILEEIGLERVGAPGTTAALAMLNDQVKKGGVMASSYVGGLSGAFIPVSEDQGMIDAVNLGALIIWKNWKP